MLLQEQFHKTMSKLDEIAMFMVDYRDIINEYSSEYGGKKGSAAGYHSGNTGTVAVNSGVGDGKTSSG